MKKAFYNLERDGITQSLLALFLACRQKARLYLEGWNSKYCSAALMFGSLGHGILEQAYLDIKTKKLTGVPSEKQAEKYSSIVEKMWLRENPKPKGETIEQLEIFLALLEKMVPRYFDFWRNDFKKMRWQALEEQFDVMVLNPRTALQIRVRGKQDGRFMLRNELWILETKTKSMISESDLVDSLSLDLQVNIYLLAEYLGQKSTPVGVLYNIVRKTALKINKSETVPQFTKRVARDIDDRPEFYFMRMEIPILKGDILRFKEELNGMLEDFFNWQRGVVAHYKNPGSCIGKYGKCEYLGVCSRNDYSSLVKRTSVFKELDDF